MVKPRKSILSKELWLPTALRSYTDPVSGVTVVGDTPEMIAKRVLREREAKGLPVGDPIVDVEEWLCQKLPAWCNRIAEPYVKKNYTHLDVKAFLASVGDSVKSGVVDKEEAGRRATICTTCPYNQKVSGCEGCSGVANAVYKLIGSKATHVDGKLKQCGICGCSLKAKVWVKPAGIKSATQIQKNLKAYPSWCWVPSVFTQAA
jgi:hypothetical protein